MNQQVPTPSVGGIRCPWCGSTNVHVQAVSEVKQRGCFTVLLYLVLLCIPVVGWVALFFLLRGRKSRTSSYAVCQNCGQSWKLE